MKALSQEATARVCQGLLLLLQGGLCLADAACLLAREESGSAAPVLDQLGQRLDRGEPLWEAMAQTEAFPGYVPGLIRVGEETGRLEEALETLADYYDRNVETAGRIRRALSYPCLILVLMLGVLGVLLVKVLPVFQKVYASLGSRLTGGAAALLELGQLLQRMLPGLFALLAALLAAAVCLVCLPGLRQRVTEGILRRFGHRGILGKFGRARFAQGLAMGLRSGLSDREAAELARQLMDGDPGLLRRIDTLLSSLEEGSDLPRCLEEQGLMPPPLCRMLALGRRSGSGDRVMEEAARRMMAEARQTLEDAAARIEPALVLVTSGLVGLVLLSALLPLMNIMSTIG